jgi:hypothetical protein
VPAQTQGTHVQRLNPKNKEVSSYIPLQADYRIKKQSSTHIWLHVILLAISFSQCSVFFFMFQFLKFYLSALSSLPPASLSDQACSGWYGHRPCLIIRTQPVCFSSGPPLWYIINLYIYKLYLITIFSYYQTN